MDKYFEPEFVKYLLGQSVELVVSNLPIGFLDAMYQQMEKEGKSDTLRIFIKRVESDEADHIVARLDNYFRNKPKQD